MAPEGVPKYRIDARTMTRYSNNKRTEFVEPVLWFFRPGEPALEVKADKAWMSRDREQVQLLGNVVVVQPETPARRAYTIETESALVYPAKEFATTDQPLTVHGEDFFIESVGGDVDLRSEHIRFHSQVNGVYEP